MPFSAVDRVLDLPALEASVLDRWVRDDTFAESLRRREGAPAWVFYEGPPTANGRPGIHHVWARLFKDLYPRFHTMRGRYVARKAGWDCHGLPVEVEVEKELGFTGKHEIEAYGIEAFNQKCRESVQRYVGDFEDLTRRIGMWLDIGDAYWTMSSDFVESVWWLFSRMWANGDIEEGFKVVPYCARCGTALSSHELGQPGAYRDVTEDSAYVRFPVVGEEFDLLVWTTTPWTLPSNTAVAVGPGLDYVRVRVADRGGRDLVLAESRVVAVLGPDAEVVEAIAPARLVGLRYERPFSFLPVPDDPASASGSAPDFFRVVADEFVTADDGSGIVHLAPAFGEVDREVAAREGIGVLNPVGPDGTFDASMPAPFAGRFVKDTDAELIERLGTTGRLAATEAYTHSYPHCWRCGTALIYWAKPTWFARTARHRDAMLRENESIGWHPEHIKHGRFGDWLANNVDWALSRDRFWGTPIPVWRCDDCRHDTCVGSVAELGELAGRSLDDLDLHRPFVDDVVVRCPECGGEARRVAPVLDAWFDSGSMPAAQLHYPFDGDDALEGRFPADFICEAIDQTRGWFYSLLAVNTLVFEQAPYRNVVCLALLVDQNGQKMSKSKGNVIDPWSVLDTRGADAMRWYFFSAGSPWTPRRVFLDGIDESARRFLFTLWNTYSFFVTYANLDGWAPDAPPARSTHVLDRWIRSRVHSTVTEVTDALDGFDALRGAQALERLVDDLSNWYVRRSRSRFWKAADPAAHATLYEALTTTVLLLAPFCPFVADEMWANLVPGTESVHLADWPDADGTAVDRALEAEMAAARQVVTLGRAARTEAKLKVRQPLPRALVLFPGVDWSPDVVREIADELNVKRVEPVHDLEGLLDYTVVPNFRVLGPRLGPRMPKARELLTGADGATIRRAFEQQGEYVLEIDGEVVAITPDDVEIRAAAHEELAVVQDGPVAVALDTTIDDDLRLEGLARELVRALNDLRKERDLALSDRVRITLRASGAVLDAARRHGEWIAGEVLALEWAVEESTPSDDDAPLLIDGIAVGVALAVA